jgi:hypothetical protein
MAQQTLRKALNLAGTNSLQVMLKPKKDQSAEQRFTAVQALLTKDIEPVLMDYLTGLKLEEALKKCDTLELLQQVVVNSVPLSFKETLADYIDAMEDFVFYEKVWLFDTFLSMFYTGAKKFTDKIFMERAQSLMNAKRIITV